MPQPEKPDANLPLKPLPDEQQRALLIELHQIIHDHVEAAIKVIKDPDAHALSYPPEGPNPTTNLTPEEKTAIKALGLTSDAMSGLKKILADTCCGVPFQFFCLLDGVSDPYIVEIPQWSGAHLVKTSGDTEFLHDALYETYWDYQEKTAKP